MYISCSVVREDVGVDDRGGDEGVDDRGRYVGVDHRGGGDVVLEGDGTDEIVVGENIVADDGADEIIYGGDRGDKGTTPTSPPCSMFILDGGDADVVDNGDEDGGCNDLYFL